MPQRSSMKFKMPQIPAPVRLKKFLELEKIDEKAECCQKIKAHRPMARRMKKGM